MEYCVKGDLNNFVEKQKGKLLEENVIWKIFIEVVLGIDALHKAKFLHRDLKSLNIFLSKDGSARVGDLG